MKASNELKTTQPARFGTENCHEKPVYSVAHCVFAMTGTRLRLFQQAARILSAVLLCGLVICLLQGTAQAQDTAPDWDSLSEEQQQQVLEAGKAATLASAEFLRAEEAKIRDELVSRGMEISDPADDEKEFIEMATSTVWPKFYDQIGGVEVLNTVLTSLGRPTVE